MDTVAGQIEALVADDPTVSSYFSLVGGAVRGLYTNKIGNEGQVDIELIPADQRDISTIEYVEQLRPKVAELGRARCPAHRHAEQNARYPQGR